ncbi:substrate-binding periplasmic protein [Dasania marina]|uniref:substrate-binding periplasmic protein n=1 Tax=Dasania marina TaxID=471499 RepID=UPI000374D52C|nr:transporter substrate-binding domain-containing protein [Dasania marina]
MALKALLYFTFLWLLLCNAPNADDIVIVSDRWYPYSGIPRSPMPGYAIEIAQYAFEKNGHNLKHQLWSIKKATRLVKVGKKNCLVSHNRKHIDEIISPAVAIANDQKIFIRRNTIDWQFSGINSLKEIILGTIYGYSYSEEISLYIATLNNPTAITNTKGKFAIEHNLSALIKGEIDVVVGSKAVLTATLKKHHWQDQVSFAGNAGPTENIYIACSPKLPSSYDYVKLISQAIDELRASGELQQLLKKYQLNDNQ